MISKGYLDIFLWLNQLFIIIKEIEGGDIEEETMLDWYYPLMKTKDIFRWCFAGPLQLTREYVVKLFYH